MMKFGWRNSKGGMNGSRTCCARRFRNPQSAIPIGLTLIELLVVIVILTTLVGGVIPVLSPNNDTRKIRAAARGLQGYITVAQTKAARTGRPHGISFRESSAGSGVALEVFGLEVPPPFAGFSDSSTAVFRLVNAANYQFEIYLGEGRGQSFIAGTGFDIPPRLLRPNDIITIGGVDFRLQDDGNVETVGNVTFFQQTSKFANAVLVNSNRNSMTFNFNYQNASVPPGAPGASLLTSPNRYQIYRQPTNSSEAPYQLPAGIAIDMQASVTEGNATAIREPSDKSLYIPRTDPNFVGIMFSPTGAVDRVIFNDVELNSVSRTVLLLGRVENGGLTGGEWQVGAGEKIEDVQERVNWLNLDSRLLSIVTSNGRSVVSEPAFVDPNVVTDADDQIEAAHEFAHDMSTVGGD